MITRIFVLIISLFLITSCKFKMSNEAPAKLNYLDGVSKFDVDKFFNSNLKGFAIILNADGKIVDKVETYAEGSWSGNKGTIKFEYIYKANRKDYRTWLITKQSSEKFSIVGHDFIGEAKGRQEGNASEIIYKMNYNFNGSDQKIDFVDNFYQVSSNSVITITELYHNGDLVGKIIGSFAQVNGEKSLSDSAN